MIFERFTSILGDIVDDKTKVYQNALIQYYPLLYSYCEHDIDVAQTCIVFIYSAINKKMHFQLVDTEHTFTMTT